MLASSKQKRQRIPTPSITRKRNLDQENMEVLFKFSQRLVVIVFFAKGNEKVRPVKSRTEALSERLAH